MSDSLGLSIGTINLVAARPGAQPVSRRSVLTLWGNRPSEVGVPSQNPELTSPNLAAAGLGIVGLMLILAPSPLFAGEFLVAAIVLLGLLRLVAGALMWILRRLPRPRSPLIRLAASLA